MFDDYGAVFKDDMTPEDMYLPPIDFFTKIQTGFNEDQDSMVGDAFTVSAQIDPAGNNVCVVKGTINLSNLSCQGIVVSDGLIAQTVPSCSNPNFIIGIPKCTMTPRNILSMSLKGIQAGQGALSFTGAKVIGAGISVPFAVQSGIYKIDAPKSASVNNKIVVTNTATGTNSIATGTSEASQNNLFGQTSQTAAVGVAGTTTPETSNTWTWIIGVIVIVMIGLGIYMYPKPKANN